MYSLCWPCCWSWEVTRSRAINMQFMRVASRRCTSRYRSTIRRAFPGDVQVMSDSRTMVSVSERAYMGLCVAVEKQICWIGSALTTCHLDHQLALSAWWLHLSHNFECLSRPLIHFRSLKFLCPGRTTLEAIFGGCEVSLDLAHVDAWRLKFCCPRWAPSQSCICVVFNKAQLSRWRDTGLCSKEALARLF
mmetsp:Transcript_6177/g.12850  ORF Transcript_6177/g.12850 Transcript_6177/m.12850 type:complete len:191 (+) Transcript_6177:165-737(+)